MGVAATVLAFAGTQASLAEQAPKPAAPKAAAPAPTTAAARKPVKPFRTSWGDPDLQGIWSNATTTPLERPNDLEGKTELSDAEHEERQQKVQATRSTDNAPTAGDPGTYNEIWWERGKLLKATSIIIDPPDGRLPAFTEAGQKRFAAIQASRQTSAADSWLDRSAYDRCITRGVPGAMLPGFYNHNYQIVQAPGLVAIVVEMIHDARIIPLDGRPHLPSNIRQWLGDSRGHFEGNTLVVETTNVNDKVFERSASTGFGGNVKMVERFTRTGGDAIDYQFTIDDPTTFTKPWTVSAPMMKIQGPIYEYA
jgi:hypothetical protein